MKLLTKTILNYTSVTLIAFMVLFSVGCVRQNKQDTCNNTPLKTNDNSDFRFFKENIDNDSIIDDGYPLDYLIPKNDAGICPEFPGGEKAMFKFLSDNIIYPDSAKKANIEGKVYACIDIDTNGKVCEINIIRGLSNDINKEAIRVLSLMPKWSPGTSATTNGKIRFKMNLVVSFSLAEDNLKKNNKSNGKNINNKKSN